jgi:hypothetical protein
MSLNFAQQRVTTKNITPIFVDDNDSDVNKE